MIVAAILLVILNGLFVAAEFAFVKIRHSRLDILAKDGNRRAQAALFGKENLDAYLSVCQLGITLASLGLGWLGEPAVAALLRPIFAALGIDNPSLVHSLSIIIGFSIITFAHVTFGELAPKTISIRMAEKTVLILAVPMRVFYILFFPAVKVLNEAARLTLVLFGAASWHSDAAHDPEELKILLAESKEEGHIDEAEERFVTNIFNMDKRLVRDLMVHRTKVISLSIDDTVDEAIHLIKKHGFTRFPVYESDKENIKGFIHAKDLLRADLKTTVSHFLRPALDVYDHLPIDDVLELMQNQNQQFGLVWDEYGGFQGLITMEDIIEVIVGSIQDEFDNEEPEVCPQPGGDFLLSSTISLDELKKELEIDLGSDSDEHYRPLSSLLLEQLADVPKAGDSVELYGFKFTIEKLDGTSIQSIRAHKILEGSDSL